MREKNPNYISSITEYTITRTTYLPEREEIVFDLSRKFLESLGPEFRDMFYIPGGRKEGEGSTKVPNSKGGRRKRKGADGDEGCL